MKKFIVFLVLLSLVVLPAVTQAEKPLGSRGNGVLMTDHWPVPPKQEVTAAMRAQQIEALAFPPYPYEDTFTLHSYPSSQYKLYLDFDGHKGGYKAWDIDGNPRSFSDAERLVIQKAWFTVSEDYIPFTIDVTTEDPGSGFLGARAVIDGGRKYDYGWAYKNTWPNTTEPVYAYPGDDTWYWIGTMVSHETGHTLNLFDHGDDAWGYYMGHGTGWTMWGAIMGWDSDSLGVWDDGDYPNPNHPEDSLALMTAKQGAGYRPDDHGSTTGTATPITLSSTLELVAEGIIEQNTDVDYFSFTMTASGDVTFSINEDVVMGTSNLDVLAKIHNSGGAVLYTSNPLYDIWASFDVTLGAGDYYLSIDGTGQDHPGGIPSEGYGYSDYGIMGYYSIYAAIGLAPDVTPPAPDPMTWATAPYSAGNSSVGMVATTAIDTEDNVEYYFTCTAGGGNDSGWQDGTFYADTGLTSGAQYTYTVTARDKSPAQNATAASSSASATTSSGINILLPGNGGLLESFTSEYSVGWGSAANLTNGSTTDDGWCTEANPSSPQEVVYSFLGGNDATLDLAVIHTGNAELGIYHSKDVQVWTSANGTDFTLAGSATLPSEQFYALVIDLGGVTAQKVKLSILNGYRTDYWETGEFEVYGDASGGCTATDMHIEAVVCGEVGCGQGKKNGQVTVTIYDDCGDPVSGALVDVTFSGDINETINDVATNASGQAVITTSACVRRPSFTVTVDDVTGALPYDSNDDLASGCSG